MVGSKVEHEEWVIEVDPAGVGDGPGGTDLHRIGYTSPEPDPDGRTFPFWSEAHTVGELEALHDALEAYLNLEKKRWA